MADDIPFASMSFDPPGAARVLDVSQSKIFQLLASGELASFKVGRARRITGAAIDALRQRNAV